MKKFEVCIRGRNFLIPNGSQVKKNGFITARLVEADDYSAAVSTAMDLLRAELKEAVKNDKSDPPVMKLEEVKEVFYFIDKMTFENIELPVNGFIWYEE